jgi:hypothetical protein
VSVGAGADGSSETRDEFGAHRQEGWPCCGRDLEAHVSKDLVVTYWRHAIAGREGVATTFREAGGPRGDLGQARHHREGGRVAWPRSSLASNGGCRGAPEEATNTGEGPGRAQAGGV